MACPSFLRSQRGKLSLLVLILLAFTLTLLVRAWISSEGPVDVIVPVHSDAAITLSLHPSEPVIVEGEHFQVTCLATGDTKVHVYFELPPLSDHLKSTVHTYQHTGGAVLEFDKVEAGHEAKYVCHAEGSTGAKAIGVMDMQVMKVRTSDQLPNRPPHPLLPEEASVEGPKRSSPSPTSEEVVLAGDQDSTASLSVPTFASMEDRGKYQRDQVDKFCQRHNMDAVKHELPVKERQGKSDEVYSFNRHMLLDNKHHILFCFVPKIGCTNLKLLVFVSQGIIRRSELFKARDAVNQVALETAMAQHSFITASEKKKQEALKSYFKFTMFRNPLERLASGYRSKVERFPLVGLSDAKPHFNWLRKDIYHTLHREEYAAWRVRGGVTPINITFSDFIDYWTNFPIVNRIDGYLDEHFLLINDMCQPCRVRFDFYGNFNHFERDAQVLINKIGARREDLRSGYYSEDTSTDARMLQYYSTLTEGQKKQVLKKMALELEFFYAIFPEERDSHKRILNIDVDIAVL